MVKKHRRHTAAFKFRVALEGSQTTNQYLNSRMPTEGSYFIR